MPRPKNGEKSAFPNSNCFGSFDTTGREGSVNLTADERNHPAQPGKVHQEECAAK